MKKVFSNQAIQDWITQQWVKLCGKKINKSEYAWLLGPFGNTSGIGLKFIEQLAKNENLLIDNQRKNKGLLCSINQLQLSKNDLDILSKDVIDFYESTSNYEIDLTVTWNPFFKILGIILKILFSNRIEQLNIPIRNLNQSNALQSEIIHLQDDESNETKRIIWLRSFKETQQIVYSGVYETCVIPSGKTCIKAIFPLPNGNATVVLSPSVGNKGELILMSSGKKIGESGFYFLLNESDNFIWANHIKSFKDELVIRSNEKHITANQTFTLWNLTVLKIEYKIKKYQPSI